MSNEQAFFFKRGGARLFGMLHCPSGSVRDTAFVMSHPFGEEKLWAHRVFVTVARALVERGHPVLRFDYEGAGDSSGTTAETSLGSHILDLTAAIRELRGRQPHAKRVGIIGLRLGASFAALLAGRAAADTSLEALREAPLVLWDPVIDGEAYFQELLRSNLSTQLAVYGKVVETRDVLQERLRTGGRVNVDGYEIGAELFATCGRAALLEPSTASHAGPVLVLQIVANDKVKERGDLRGLAEAYKQGEFARAVEEPFWREIRPFYGRAEDLQRVTLQWLEKRDV